MQVRLRIGRLTLGLTVADRWECSQASGLLAWRHQDLHITANRATRYHRHSNGRICIRVLVPGYLIFFLHVCGAPPHVNYSRSPPPPLSC